MYLTDEVISLSHHQALTLFPVKTSKRPWGILCVQDFRGETNDEVQCYIFRCCVLFRPLCVCFETVNQIKAPTYERCLISDPSPLTRLVRSLPVSLLGL